MSNRPTTVRDLRAILVNLEDQEMTVRDLRAALTKLAEQDSPVTATIVREATR